MKGQLSEAELHFIRARLRGGIVSKARRGELITPLPVGLAYDAAGHVILDPDTAVQGALRRLFATFEATGSASACVKEFNAAGLTFPWRHRAGPPRPVRGRARKSRKRWRSWRTWALTGIARSVSREVDSDGAHSAQRPSSLRASAAAPVGLPQSGHRAE